MATKETLFTVAGITTHSAPGATVTKVRFGTDLIRLVKMLNNPKKIWHTATAQCLAPVRVDFVTLPTGMLKADALKFLAAHPDFQSPADQAVIAEESGKRAPKAPRVAKPKAARTVKVKATKATAPSLDSIKSRPRKSPAGVADVLAAVGADQDGVTA